MLQRIRFAGVSLFCFALLAWPLACAAEIGVAWLEDASGKLPVEAVAAAERGADFAPAPGGTLNFGLSDSAYWLRFTVPAGAPDRLIEVATPYLDFLDFYRARPGGGFERVATGDHRAFGSREIEYRHPVFRVPGGARAETVHYLRIGNAGAIQVPLRFWSADEFRLAATQEHYLFGLFYGVLLVMVLYNLFLFLAVRDRAYLWYVAYVALFGLFIFARNGFAFQWLWPASPWLGNFAHYLLIAGAIAAAVQFTRCFLDTGRRTPRIDGALRLAAAFGLVVAAVTLAEWQRAAVLLVQFHSLTAVGLGIAAAILVWRSGYAPARFYLLAFATLMASSLFSVARNLGAFPANFVSTYGVQLGSAVEIVLLALGLADRINVLKQEKARAQADVLRTQEVALATLRQSEIELERRVHERTGELRRANELLQLREQALEHLAHHDPLTGLANRALFEDRLARALVRARRHQSMIAVLLVDLDGFKPINDLHGHGCGDAVLRAVAGRMRGVVRESDTVARHGGDEFVILLDDLRDPADCGTVAAKLLQAQREPLVAGEVALTVTLSIGSAVFPRDGEDAAGLLGSADRAMYAAKRSGRNAWRRAGDDAEAPQSGA